MKSEIFQFIVGTYGIPRKYDPYDAYEYYNQHFSQKQNMHIIASSAGALPAIEIARKRPQSGGKLILLNPAITLNSLRGLSLSIIVVCGTKDGGERAFTSNGYDIGKNVQFIELYGDHSFKGQEKPLNELIGSLLNDNN
ncbi:MAG: hypothetical protein V3575_00455 [Candidatus Absconditabacteria bacterium]